MRTAVDRGLPAVLEAPLWYLVTQQLQDVDAHRVAGVERLRAALLARRGTVVDILASPEPGTAGPIGSPACRLSPGEVRSVDLGEVATRISVDPVFGTLLYLLAKQSEAQTILELGSCAGIAGSYMAAAGCGRFVGVEASGALAAIARSNVHQVNPDAQIVEAPFDDALDNLRWPAGIDMVHIDGQHEKRATLHLLQRIRGSLNPGAIVVFDDITWSRDMRDAWAVLRTAEGFSATVDLGRVGAALWQGATSRPRTWDLSALRGRPPLGDPFGER